jgi:cysteine synthase
MKFRSSDGATIGIEAAGGNVVVTFEYAGSSGELRLVLSHARTLAAGMETILQKYGTFLAMDPGLKKREADIRGFVKHFKKIAG